MFSRSVTIFRAFGFPIRIDLSWLFIAFVMAWSLASNYFPAQLPGRAPPHYWIMGVTGMLGLFASVVLHELGHALVARRFGVEMGGITLFIFGGVAEMASDPPSPKAEFWVAVGGPLVSLALAGTFTLVSLATWPESVVAVVAYLGFINGILLLFNLVPAFPLDGGRVLRAILWQIWGSVRRATRVVAAIGSAFGFALIGFGLLNLIWGQLIGAIWWTLLGFFVRSAAASGYQQVLARKLLQGETVARFMRVDPISVSPEATLQEIVEGYLYLHAHKFYPVAEGARPVGYITVRRIKEVPRERWAETRAREIAEPISPENTISPQADATEALERMNQSGISRLLVVSEGALVGVLTLKDMMRFLAMKIDLGENEPKAARFVQAQADKLD